MITGSLFTKKRVIFLFILIGLIAWCSHAYFSKQKQTHTVTIAVTTTKVEQKDVDLTMHAIGNVQPYVTVSVKSRVEGQLLSVGFKEGDYVTAGQVIFQIDPHAYQVSLEQAKANLARDEAQLENLQKLLVRYGQLVEKGYISKQDYDAASANVKAQAATVLADKASVANMQLNLDYCTIHAPINGKTGNLLVNQGNLIKNDTTPLVIINQIKPIYIVFSLPEQWLDDLKSELKNGLVPVTIQLKGNPEAFKAELSFIDNAVDATTGMIQLKALFANDHEEIWPGQYVDVSLPIQEIKQAVLVPTRAIQAGPDGAYVFVVKDDLHVMVQPITLGPVIENNTVIQSGLMKDAVIVATGQSQLVDGSLVQVKTGNDKELSGL